MPPVPARRWWPAGLLAIVIVGAWLVTSTGAVPHADTSIVGWVAAHRPGWLVDGARVVTELGRFPVALAVTLVAGVALAWAGAWQLAWRPLAALMLAANVGPAIKDAIGRARPPQEFWEVWAPGSGYPSGHSGQAAAAWLALAFALSARWPRQRGRLLAAGTAVMLLVGLSRVVLGVHSPTDVLAGWALGTAFALLLAPRRASRPAPAFAAPAPKPPS
ncbi:MAG: phosphatase PAP2 family protein [Patulibacter sp.]